MPLTIAQGTDKNPRDMLFLFKVLVGVTSTDILKSSWFNSGSLFVCYCISFLKKLSKTLSPAVYLLFTRFPFSFNKAKTSKLKRDLHLPADIWPLAQAIVLLTLCTELLLQPPGPNAN